MADTLDQGDRFPPLELSLAGGGSRALPDGIETPYLILLFYRGHW